MKKRVVRIPAGGITAVIWVAAMLMWMIWAAPVLSFAGPMQVSAGANHTIGLMSDGELVGVGTYYYGQTDVSGWSDMVQVAAGNRHTVGLRSDGTVAAVGSNSYGQLDVSGWTDIVEVAAGDYHTLGRKSDGTVVAAGRNNYGQTDVSAWPLVDAVAAGRYHSLGLKSNGTVVAAGYDGQGQSSVGWTSITQLAGGGYHTVGLRSDGTVAAVGSTSYGQLDVSSWSDIVQVAAGAYHTVGVKSDGTVVATGHSSYGQLDVSGWSDIIQVSAGDYHTVGLRSDGTVAAAGKTSYSLSDAAYWSLQVPDSDCIFTLSPDPQDFSTAGGTGYVTVGASKPDCDWVVKNSLSWVGVSPDAGSGDGAVTLTVDENTDPSDRSGTLTIGKKTLAVTQDGASCTYSVFPASADFDSPGGTATVEVTPSDAGCGWSVSENLSWLTANPDAGTGAQTVTLTVDENTDPSDRSGTLTIAGETVTVTQNGAVSSALKGTTISFVDNQNPGLTILGYGKYQTLGVGEYILVGEDAPGSLLKGGTINLELSNGAKFNNPSPGLIELYSDNTYQSKDLLVSQPSAGTGSTSQITLTVTEKSTQYPGAFMIDLNAANWLDTASATPGDVTLTISGNAGVSGTVKIGTIISSTLPFVTDGIVSNASVTHEFYAAGNDIGKVGSIYVFTNSQWYNGTSWEKNETAYYNGATLSSSSISYSTAGLKDGTKVYIGYGVGLTNTATNMSTNGTFVQAYTVSGTTDPSKGPSTVEQISILSPVHQEVLSYGATGGQVTFMFTKAAGAAKYVLHIELHDILNQTTIPIPVDLVPPGSSTSTWTGGTSGTPGFSENTFGMVFDLTLDTTTWDVMSQYDITWGIEAYDGSGTLVGSTHDGSDFATYVNKLKLMGSSAIVLKSPVPGTVLSKTDSAPLFQWDQYQGTATYSLILAHVASVGFDVVVQKDNLSLNLLTMDDPTWQSMPEGTWYWTVLGIDGMGGLNPQDYTIFDFTVGSSGGTTSSPPLVNPPPAPGMSLGKASVSLDAGDKETVSISGGTGTYNVTTSSSQVAAAYTSNNSLVLTGKSAGTATVTVTDTNGSTASVAVTVSSAPVVSGNCGAFVAPNVWKEFDCYNLAAIGKTTGADPFTPSWELIGGYWQWGRKGPDAGQWHNTNTPNFAHGPTGPGDSETNSVSISGWDSSYAPDGAWSDASKTANDPCPAGFRVPTKAQWQGVVDNNTQSTVGTWSSSNYDHTNYSAARFFGNDLMLPAAGTRYSSGSGALYRRGTSGGYWSSSEVGSNNAWHLYFGSSSAGASNYYRRLGFSVRCVAE